MRPIPDPLMARRTAVVRPVRFRFDDFLLAPRQRVLLRNGTPRDGIMVIAGVQS
jgi:hypothetical protein